MGVPLDWERRRDFGAVLAACWLYDFGGYPIKSNPRAGTQHKLDTKGNPFSPAALWTPFSEKDPKARQQSCAMLTYYAAACAAGSQRQSDLQLPLDPPPVLPLDALAATQPRAIIHRADRMQGIGISMAGFQLAFQLAERSNRSLYTDWNMFLVGFEGIHEPPQALESADSQAGEAWTWEREGHENQPPGTAARLAAADKPTVVELSGDDLSVQQVRDAWRLGGTPRLADEEEQVFEDYNRRLFLERYTPSKYVRENLAALGSHERVVHIRVGDGAGPDGEGPCHVEDSRIDLSAGMAALQQAILDHWKVPLADASSILLLSDCSEVHKHVSNPTLPYPKPQPYP